MSVTVVCRCGSWWYGYAVDVGGWFWVAGWSPWPSRFVFPLRISCWTCGAILPPLFGGEALR